MPVGLAPEHHSSAVTPNLPQRALRLNLRPVGARRLPEAGRHWAPIARQRATREERRSDRTWPAYCNQPKWAPPVIDGLVRTVACSDQPRKWENEFLNRPFLEGL